MELISREEAIKQIDEAFDVGECYSDKYAIRGILKSLPTIEEQKDGKWIPRDWTDIECPERLRRYKCSICGKAPVTIVTGGELVGGYGAEAIGARWEFETKVFFSNYCPYCGAKMKGE